VGVLDRSDVSTDDALDDSDDGALELPFAWTVTVMSVFSTIVEVVHIDMLGEVVPAAIAFI
jgi:hypothetical protein